MYGDGRIDQVASERPQARQCAILIGTSQPAISDHVRRQDRRKFPGLGHDIPPLNGEFWPAELWGRISRLNTEFCNLIQGALSDQGCRLLALNDAPHFGR
jgi:hypothetical protein